MYSLDIATEKGQETLEQEARAWEIWRNNYPTLLYLFTNKARPADVDGILVRWESGALQAVVECKCRDADLDTLKTAFSNEWLVTEDKIKRAVAVSVALRLPLLGWLYLAKDDLLLYVKITDADGKFLVRTRVARTETQRTVNGGKAVRDNMFIDMSEAKILRLERSLERGR